MGGDWVKRGEAPGSFHEENFTFNQRRGRWCDGYGVEGNNQEYNDVPGKEICLTDEKREVRKKDQLKEPT